MPPKKKGKGKKGKSPVQETNEAREEVTTEPSMREKYLQKELDGLTDNLVKLKKEVEELRHENEFLQQEAQQTRVESHEYMSYMTKKTHKRQTTIISLSDQNQRELEKIVRQKQLMLADYEEKQNGLKSSLLEKENLLSKARKEFADLAEYRELREEQLRRIKQLEREVLHTRGRHSDTIQHLKAAFLEEKSQFSQQSEDTVQELAREANKKAVQCLSEHASNIKQENRGLRTELLGLIQRSHLLNQHKKELEEQRKQLLREKQYGADIRRLRGDKRLKTLKAMQKMRDDEVFE